MKIFPSLLTLLCLSTRLLALDAAQVSSVTAKFSDPSGDVQYAARIELDKLIDAATAPGNSGSAAATRTLEEILAKPETSKEAKKYLLRVLSRVGTAESVPAVLAIFRGSDAMLKEEARQVLESLKSPAAITALTAALTAATTPQERLALLESLGINRATNAVPAIAALITKPDAKVALAAAESLGKIGGPEAITTLGKLRTEASLSAPLKQEIDKALLFAGKTNAKVVKKVYQTAGSPEVKLAAFLLLNPADSPAAVIQDAMKSEDSSLRLAAIKRGMAANTPDLLQGGLNRSTDPFSPNERLVILQNLPLLKPTEAAVGIAIDALKSESTEERASAITALGILGGKPAFDAVFQSLTINEPTISRALASAISRIDAPAADEFLLAKIQGPESPEKVLAIKAAASRLIPGVRPLLVQTILSSEKQSAQESMKTLYAIGGIEELKLLCAAASSSTDAAQRGSLASFCKRLATRLATDEAKQLADALKAD